MKDGMGEFSRSAHQYEADLGTSHEVRYTYVMEKASSTPLSVKLGVRDGSTMLLLHAPKGLELKLPPRVTVRRRLSGQANVVLAFFTKSSALLGQLDALCDSFDPSGALWIAWPKKSSDVTSEITDHVVRSIALPRGLVDNKVCAIDETWTGLRLVWRRAVRALVK